MPELKELEGDSQQPHFAGEQTEAQRGKGTPLIARNKWAWEVLLGSIGDASILTVLRYPPHCWGDCPCGSAPLGAAFML